MENLHRMVEGSNEWLNHIKSNESTEAQRMFSSESYFTSLWQHSHHAMAIVSEDGTIVDGNPAFCNLLGIEYNECLGLKIKNFVADGQFRQDMRMIQTMVCGRMYQGQTEQRWNFRLNPNGPFIPVRLKATRIPANLTRPFRHIIIQVYDLRSTRYDMQGNNWVNQGWQQILKYLVIQHFGKICGIIMTLLILLALIGTLGQTIDRIIDSDKTQQIHKQRQHNNTQEKTTNSQ